MDVASAIASVIAVYQLASTISGLCFHYGKGVRRAGRDADLIINEIDTLQTYLRNLKEILASEDAATGSAGRLQNLVKIVNGESGALSLCRRDLEDIKTKLVHVQSEGRFKEAIHALSWPLKQEEVSKTLNTLNKFTEAVDRALNVDNNVVIREIDNTTKRIQISLESAESQQRREKESFQLTQEQQRANEIKDKVLDWLAHPDPSEIHEITRHDRNDDAQTGGWFLNGNAFQEFKATPRSVLWLHGDSGCGKSVLCSAIIDDILAIRSTDSRTELAYWYFSVTDKKRTNLDHLLRALISQLILQCPIPSFLLDMWNSRKMGREAPRTADLVQTMERILVAETSYKYFIIIDALDESDETERADLMRLVRSLALLKADIHILVTSRTNTVGIEKGMRNLINFYNVTVEAQNADLDICAHVTERLENDDALAKWSPEMRQTIKDTLVQDAGGMFRWVECQLQAVRKCRKPAEVRKTLKTLPRNLHEVYARDLAKIDESASQDVLRLLEWLAFPQQKLRIEEAIDMLAVDMESNPPAFDEENRMVDSEEILKMCGSLVRLDTNAEGRNDVGEVGKVQTLAAAHTSVIDFLKTQPIKVGSEETFQLSRSKANLRMAETCLTYLRHFSENHITLTEENISNYPFARLCALSWADFYQEVLTSSERVDMARLNDLVMELLSTPTATLNWVKLHDPDERGAGVDFDVEQSQVKPAIYYVALLGLPDIAKSLIRGGSPVDEVVGPPFGNPLVAACARGNINVASLLLDGGADPNLSGYYHCGTPLAAAIESGSLETVELLLGIQGIEINGKRHPPAEVTEEILESLEEYGTLQYRTREDDNEYEHNKQKTRVIEIGSEIIDFAENANAGDWGDEGFRKRYDRNETHFEKAPNDSTQSINTQGKGNEDYTISDNRDETLHRNFLIRANAASIRILSSNESMVYVAARWGTLKILEVLLATGADPNIRGGGLDTALRAACFHGKEDFVRTLLMNGARLDMYEGFCGSCLNVACTYGSIAMVEEMIKAGADVNRHAAGLRSPLYRASIGGRADVVRMLLKNNAATDLYTDTIESPLQVASRTGNIEIAQILLDAGSDVNRKGDTRATALYIACENRDKTMAELLLARGANTNIQQCGNHDHALQKACVNGDEAIVCLLLENGAKPDLRGGYFNNALHAACAFGTESITRMLLSHGADVNLSVWNFGSPLVNACRYGRVEIAKLLVEAGADLGATDLVGRSALLMAIFIETLQLEVIDYLVGLGVDPSHGDKRGCNGLHYAARAKKSHVIERMLEYGNNVNGTDLNGWSPLHWAIASREVSTDIVRLLLQSGCDKNKREKQGRTALDLARLFNCTEETSILDGTAQASTKPSDEDEVWASFGSGCICDGCEVDRQACKPESWHHCTACADFDFCFRCILDKDIIHFKDHEFTNEPA